MLGSIRIFHQGRYANKVAKYESWNRRMVPFSDDGKNGGGVGEGKSMKGFTLTTEEIQHRIGSQGHGNVGFLHQCFVYGKIEKALKRPKGTPGPLVRRVERQSAGLRKHKSHRRHGSSGSREGTCPVLWVMGTSAGGPHPITREMGRNGHESKGKGKMEDRKRQAEDSETMVSPGDDFTYPTRQTGDKAPPTGEP
jgi:hypothetical protein